MIPEPDEGSGFFAPAGTAVLRMFVVAGGGLRWYNNLSIYVRFCCGQSEREENTDAGLSEEDAGSRK